MTTTTKFFYDKLNRLTKKVSPAGAVYYAYDASGKRTSVKDRDLKESVYVYDNVGRLTTIEVDALRSTYFAYNTAGQVTRKVLPDIVMSYYSYDTVGRLSQLENRGPVHALLISYFAYDRNESGAITRIRHEGNEDTYYSYDALDRLTREWRLPTTANAHFDNYYAYDAASNRIQKTDASSGSDVNTYFTHDARNLIQREWNKTATTTTYFEYDDAQRMTAAKILADQSAYFSYDQRDQVTQVEFKGGADKQRAFKYTSLGERYRIEVGNPITAFLDFTYDGSKLLTERNAVSTLTTRYRHNEGPLDSRGSLMEVEESSGDKLYPSFDQRGTVSNLSQDVGGETLKNTYAFDAFGVSVYENEQISTNERLRFVSPVFQDLGTAQAMSTVGGLVFMPPVARMTAAAAVMAVGPFLGLYPSGQARPSRGTKKKTRRYIYLGDGRWLYLGTEEGPNLGLPPKPKDGSFPGGTPGPVVYGEVIDECNLPDLIRSGRGSLISNLAAGLTPEPADVQQNGMDPFQLQGENPTRTRRRTFVAEYKPSKLMRECCDKIVFAQEFLLEKGGPFDPDTVTVNDPETGQREVPVGSWLWDDGGSGRVFYPGIAWVPGKRAGWMIDQPRSMRPVRYEVCAVCIQPRRGIPADTARSLKNGLLACVTWGFHPDGSSMFIGNKRSGPGKRVLGVTRELRAPSPGFDSRFKLGKDFF